MTLRVFVQVWCEVDPTLNLRVDRQSGRPVADGGDALRRVSPAGRLGVTAALAIKGADVAAFSLGDEDEPALRHALAAGANRAAQIRWPDANAGADPLAPLAEWLREQKPDLVIADRIAGRLAACLGWAHLAGLDRLEVAGGKLRAIRHLGRGDGEAVTAQLPAAIRLHAGSERARYVSQARIAHAANRIIEKVSLPPRIPVRPEVEWGAWQLARPRTKLGAAPVVAPASGLDRLSALMGVGRGAIPASATPEPAAKTPDQMAEELVRYLAHHNLLDS